MISRKKVFCTKQILPSSCLFSKPRWNLQGNFLEGFSTLRMLQKSNTLETVNELGSSFCRLVKIFIYCFNSNRSFHKTIKLIQRMFQFNNCNYAKDRHSSRLVYHSEPNIAAIHCAHINNVISGNHEPQVKTSKTHYK